MNFTSVAQLIRAARNCRSQREFAQLLGVEQSTVSRYERGKANPPVKVIEHCMRLMHAEDEEVFPTADELAEKIHSKLADPNLGEVRLALAKLIEGLASEHSEAHVTGHSAIWDI